MRIALVLVTTSLGCADGALISGTLLDSASEPIANHPIACYLGTQELVDAHTDDTGAFACDIPRSGEYGVTIATAWRDVRMIATGSGLLGDNDMGPMRLLEQPVTVAAEGLELDFSWQENPAPGLERYALELESESWAGSALYHLTERTSIRVPAIAVEDWQLEARVLHIMELGEFSVSMYSPGTPVTGAAPPLSRGAACRWTYVDNGAPEEVVQDRGQCRFSDGQLYSLALDSNGLSEVVLDLGAAVDASTIVVRDLITSADDDARPPADEETFVVEVGLTEDDYRATLRLPAEGVKVYGLSQDQQIRYVRLRADPARNSWLQEVSVF